MPKDKSADVEVAGYEFAKSSDAAKKWASEHAGELVDGISKATREAIREEVEAAFDEQFDVNELADRLADLLGDDARADVIARTESMRASNAGQQEAWDQAVGEGLLPDSARKVWITTPDDRACPVCDDMDGEEVGIDENFDVDGDQIDGPPAHPNCRCTVGIAGA